MNSAWTERERRQHPRVTVTGKESLIMLPIEGVVGTMIDISMGGVSFHYAGAPVYPMNVVQSCTLFGEDDFWLERVSLVTVRDVIVRYPLFSDRPCLRRRSMIFRKLDDEKKHFLKQYIWLNAADRN